MTARPPGSSPYAASTGRPSGSLTRARRSSPQQASTSAATVPSPPSAMETRTHSQPGKCRLAAASSSRAASAEESVPLSESDAKTNRGAAFT